MPRRVHKCNVSTITDVDFVWLNGPYLKISFCSISLKLIVLTASVCSSHAGNASKLMNLGPFAFYRQYVSQGQFYTLLVVIKNQQQTISSATRGRQELLW